MPLAWASFDLDFSHFYPTLYGYLAGLATAGAWAAGWIRPGAAAVFDAVLVARVVAVAASLANVVLVGLLGRRCFSAPVGLVAAAFMAALPLEATQVHYASVDSLLALWFTLTLLAGHALACRGGVLRALGAGACVGLAFSTKYTGLGALGALAVPVVVCARRGDGLAAAAAVAAAIVAGVGLGILVGCPPCVLRPSDAMGAMRMHLELTLHGDFQNARLVPSLGWVGTPYLYELLVTFPSAFGWPLWLLCLAGVAVAVRRRALADWVLLGAVATYFASVGASPLMYARYLLPLAPGLLVLAARAVVALPRRPALGWAAATAVWLYTLALAGSYVAHTSLSQQRAVAAWIAARPATPPGTRVATPRRGVEYYALTPFLVRAGLEPVVVADADWLRAPSDVLVMPELLAIGVRRDDPGGVMAQQLARLEAGEGGFREVARWPFRYLHRSVYGWLDPGPSLVLGECGFVVYERRR